MPLKRFLAALALVAFSASSHSAEAITVGEYVALKNDLKKDNTLIIYLSGAADALHSANAVLLATKKGKLYCGIDAPVSATDAIRLIDTLLAQQIKRGNAAPSNMAVSTVLANALSVSYPCR